MVKSAAQRAEELVVATLPLRARAADSAMLAPSSLLAATPRRGGRIR